MNALSSFYSGGSGQWKAIGIAALALLVLGLFKPTRTLAIVIAVVLAGTLVLKKVS